ncbi:hypothetical protein AXG89_33965 [Burkholderia sp. PAMC 26561]|nr:hypothetical protein AXG89_33965 [Burkholderia sp. PAMC 26561]
MILYYFFEIFSVDGGESAALVIRTDWYPRYAKGACFADSGPNVPFCVRPPLLVHLAHICYFTLRASRKIGHGRKGDEDDEDDEGA